MWLVAWQGLSMSERGKVHRITLTTAKANLHSPSGSYRSWWLAWRYLESYHVHVQSENWWDWLVIGVWGPHLEVNGFHLWIWLPSFYHHCFSSPVLTPSQSAWSHLFLNLHNQHFLTLVTCLSSSVGMRSPRLYEHQPRFTAFKPITAVSTMRIGIIHC